MVGSADSSGAVVSLSDAVGAGVVSLVWPSCCPSVAKAAGAASRATGLMTAVAAATAMARRSFIQTSCVGVPPGGRYGGEGGRPPHKARKWPVFRMDDRGPARMVVRNFTEFLRGRAHAPGSVLIAAP
ncbi:MAG TPA: hypothetical protein DD420_31435 [Streptomyces sp.]|nr:hypothetical protein [Streptomyces sp.]